MLDLLASAFGGFWLGCDNHRDPIFSDLFSFGDRLFGVRYFAQLFQNPGLVKAFILHRFRDREIKGNVGIGFLVFLIFRGTKYGHHYK